MITGNSKHPMALGLFSLLCAILVAHALYHYTILPERIATHFGTSGEPDAWGPKTVFFIWYLILTGAIAAIYLGTSRVLSPKHANWLSIPNREYWLSTERIHETLRFIRTGMLLLGSGTLLFLLDIMHQSFQVSLGNADRLSHIWTSVAIYIAFCAAWIIALYRRFGKTG
ncbi:MAG: DUF1648 domain-containing protein [Chlorobiaceae bacterium]|nr:DUF1648 domain-containing protein [Chlorobiaceae bacterium]NTV26239.1 DUF1648 domain-containing protein [Chlorobiaceae bacterium]